MDCRRPLRAKIGALLPVQSEWLVPTIVQYELSKWLLRSAPSDDRGQQLIAFTTRCVVMPLTTEVAVAASHYGRAHVSRWLTRSSTPRRRPTAPTSLPAIGTSKACLACCACPRRPTNFRLPLPATAAASASPMRNRRSCVHIAEIAMSTHAHSRMRRRSQPNRSRTGRPALDPRRLKDQFAAAVWIAEDVGDVEHRVADQPLGVDHPPAAVAADHVVMVEVAMQRPRLGRRRQQAPPASPARAATAAAPPPAGTPGRTPAAASSTLRAATAPAPARPAARCSLAITSHSTSVASPSRALSARTTSPSVPPSSHSISTSWPSIASIARRAVAAPPLHQPRAVDLIGPYGFSSFSACAPVAEVARSTQLVAVSATGMAACSDQRSIAAPSRACQFVAHLKSPHHDPATPRPNRRALNTTLSRMRKMEVWRPDGAQVAARVV